MAKLTDPKIVFLDEETLNFSDPHFDLGPLKKLGLYKGFKNTNASQLKNRVALADIVITNKVPINKKNFSSFKNLKLVCVAATGHNVIDSKLLAQNGIPVCNAHNYSQQSVVEQSILFLLALNHRLHEFTQATQDGTWSRSTHFCMTTLPFNNLKGKTLGIIGYGNIGKAVAKQAKQLGLKIIVAQIPGRQYGKNSSHQKLQQVLKHADFISIHCQLSELTNNLINKQSLKLLKPEASIINMARGQVVNSKDLAFALKNNKIRSYASDVLESEPPSRNHPLLQKSLKNKVLITPHIAWSSLESRQNLLIEITKNIQAFKKGKTRNQVNLF
ncbi:MAG: glycerate dehydrogenase [Deltaproteobacteria bacterium]|nr:glycerate dehydrogenase [Deltaproteobacteria bacterium]